MGIEALDPEERSSRSEMEMFAEKVRYGNGPRFDPLMEEKGGWISGEAPRQDMEMIKVVMEVMEEANKQILKAYLNLFKIQSGEILPANLESLC